MSTRAGRHAQRGVTLVELMIALLIGLFLIGGLLTLTGAMRRTSSIQNNLSLLHDSERLAMSLTTDVIQSAGFYPIPFPPGNVTAATAMPAITSGSPALAAGQSIFGVDYGTPITAEKDTVSVRYMTAGADNILNCTGGTSTTQAIWVSTFQLDAAGDFQCVQGTQVGANVTSVGAVTLVSGVKYLMIRYGVITNPSALTHSVDTYLTATQVTAGNYWGSVVSVQITLFMQNPLAGQPGQTAASQATIPFKRVIALMNQVGINT